MNLRSHTIGLLLAILAGAVPLAGHAQQAAPSYAIMSMVGDRISVITRQMTTGSRLDTNRRQDLPIPDDSLDGVAAFAADEIVKRLQPNATTALFTTRDAGVLAAQEKALDAPELPTELLEPVKALVAKAKPERIIVIAKFRTEARVRFEDTYLGSGRLSGVGFYIDRWAELRERNRGEATTGYFAPYAYLKVNVYDAATLRPLAQVTAIGTEIVTTVGSKTAVVEWEAMTGMQKFDALGRVIRKALADAVPRALEAR